MSRSLRSRDDSLNSSDSEYSTGTGETETDRQSCNAGRRASKVNLRQLEERLNMIQEECNRLSEESDDELSATIDDRSEKNDLDSASVDSQFQDMANNNEDTEILDSVSVGTQSDTEELQSDNMPETEPDTDNIQLAVNDNSVFTKIDKFLDNRKIQMSRRRNPSRSRSEGWSFSDCELESQNQGQSPRVGVVNVGVVNRLRQQPVRTQHNNRARPNSAPTRGERPLHRAHSCGSLLSRSKTGKTTGFWDLLSDKSSPLSIISRNDLNGPVVSNKSAELTLTLTSVSAPLSLLHLQTGTSRCCNLC